MEYGSILVFLEIVAVFEDVSQPAKHDDRHERHPILLLLAQRLVEWLLGFGELLEICTTLDEPICPTSHDF
jgi:hypothetical protein